MLSETQRQDMLDISLTGLWKTAARSRLSAL
jgi:hypothetical protein